MAKKPALTKTALVPVEQIASRIFLMRGHRVMLDFDRSLPVVPPSSLQHSAAHLNLPRAILSLP